MTPDARRVASADFCIEEPGEPESGFSLRFPPLGFDQKPKPTPSINW